MIERHRTKREWLKGTYPLYITGVVLVAVWLLCLIPVVAAGQGRFEITFGTVRIHSKNTKDLLNGSSNKLKGGLDLEHGTFTFQVPMSSLKGPNCPLMSVLLRAIKAEGKQEQYATFTGSILDKAELMTDGEQTVRIKGKMSINGVEQYTVMKVHLVSHNGELILGTELPVSFDDYNIRLPLVPGRGRIDEVVVEISATLVSAPDLSMK